ncbi:MAG: carbonic anhydrase [Clostridia bacterium]|nr:carbonic anhydrase [Clostridia bacterium]
METDLIQRLSAGNALYRGDGDDARRLDAARNGQHPYAVVVCCSDSRVIPERIFHAGIGDLFVVRVAGNVIGRHALGSIAYATEHLGCRGVVVLGHTGCGAVEAALSGHAEGYIADLVDAIKDAIGAARDPLAACEANVRAGVGTVRRALNGDAVSVYGAIYDTAAGAVRWLSEGV